MAMTGRSNTLRLGRKAGRRTAIGFWQNRCLAPAFLAAALSAGAQPSQEHFSLYTDKKAKRVEDVITVLVVESAKAVNDTKTQTDEKSDFSVDVGAGTGPLNLIPGAGWGMGTDNAYDGRGKTSRVGEVKATVSARVVEVYDNGNLLIEGHKEVEVNREKEILRVSGIVRSEDISPDNTVYSYKIADARIQYSGEGNNGNASQAGWLTRFFNWIF